MALVAPVNLPYNIKTLWFDPSGLELKCNDRVVVKTSRGQELGVMAQDIKEVSDEQISELRSPLMPVLRIATDEDLERAKEMEEKAAVAMEVFKRLARQTSEEMHPVSVEYMLDGEKAVFYFESEERIDFRDLVRRLAGEFHVRVDMRQIGVRDEARIVGGIAHCGQMVCCKRLGGEFKPVSIRMAKDQDMSLNPQKISGLCGRLMCCLRYESELYSDFKKTAPKIGAQISTPDGMGKVTAIDVPKESMTIKIADEKPVNVPISAICDMSEDRKSARVADEAWEDLMESLKSAIYETGGIFDLPKFTTEDKLGSAKAVHHEKQASSKDASKSNRDGKSSKRKPRGAKRRSVKIASGTNGSDDAQGKERTEAASDSSSRSGKHSRPSRTKSNRDDSKSKKGQERKGADKNGNRSSSSKAKSPDRSSKLRPGHKSSSLSKSDSGGSPKSSEGAERKSGNRRRRRRSHSGKPREIGGSEPKSQSSDAS